MQEGNNSSYGEILPSQMRLFWQKVCEGFINRDVFQAFLNNVGAFTVPRGMYYNFSDSRKKAAKIMGIPRSTLRGKLRKYKIGQ